MLLTLNVFQFHIQDRLLLVKYLLALFYNLILHKLHHEQQKIRARAQYLQDLAKSLDLHQHLLDYLDKVRFTVRSGHDRTPGVEARKLLK